MDGIFESKAIQLAAYVLNLLLISLGVGALARIKPTARFELVRATLIGLLILGDAIALLWLDCSARGLFFLVATVCASTIALREGPTKVLGHVLGTWRFAIYIASVFTISTLVYIHLPITTFLTSPGDIGIHVGALLATNLKNVITATYVAALLYALAPSPRMKTVLATLSVIILPLTLICAFAYPFGYPTMNGFMFEQFPIATSTLAIRIFVDVVTVAAVIAIALVAMIKLGAKRIFVGIAVVNVSLTVATVFRVVQDTTASAAHPGESASSSFERPIQFAKGKDNVLILFLDRFMGGFVEPILEQEPQLAAELDGFTWYPRTVAAGENSIAGLHPLLGGYDYTPREMNKRGQLLRDSSVESFAILPYNFTRKGYAANLVNPHGLGFTVTGDCSFLHIDGLHCTHIPPAVSKKAAEQYGMPSGELAKAGYADLLSLLGAMRATPYGLREVIHRRGPWTPFLENSAGVTFKQWAELKSLPALSRTDSDRSNINIVFNFLPHEPYFMGEDCLPKRSMLSVPSEELKRRGYANIFAFQHFVAARCTLLLVADYFRWMKEAGVYDSTKIVVVSDHGIVGPIEDHSSRALAGGTKDAAYVRSRSMLMVKDRQAHGTLRVSEAFMPNAEVPRIVCEEIGGCVNPYLDHRTIEAHGRDKPFYVSFVPWQFNLQELQSFKILSEMAVVDRDPYDRNGWVKEPPAK